MQREILVTFLLFWARTTWEKQIENILNNISTAAILDKCQPIAKSDN